MLPSLGALASSPRRRRLAVLGATGSIGRQTLEIVALFPDRLAVDSLAAGSDWEGLARAALAVRPRVVAVADETAYGPLKEALAGTGIEVTAGEAAVTALASAPTADVVVAAVVGAAGLRSTLAAVGAGKAVALANKESLVVAGALVAAEAARTGATVLPVDSEHSALFQCLVGEPAGCVERLTLTASGGPFRLRDGATFDAITTAEALAHPNWTMGAKISIDSATMMTKGLEVIEARWLFDVPAERIEVVIHPQSAVHSVVTFVDGSAKAQVGAPTMLVPIQVALSFPERWPAPHPRLDWPTLGALDFAAPDPGRFPCLPLAFAALAAGGAVPAAMNAANEVAVARFLAGEIRFTDIPRLVERGMEAGRDAPSTTLDDLLAADDDARRVAADGLAVATR